MLLVYVIFLACLHVGTSLDCYQCSNVNHPSECHQLTVCRDSDMCFTGASVASSTATYTMGCRTQQECFSISSSSTVSPLSIIGRDIHAPLECSQCCGSDACNKKLCDTNTQVSNGQCVDDPSYNCAHTSTIFNICADIHHAKLVCRQFCGLCNLIDGEWSSWNQWSVCNVTCGSGWRSRSRQCDNPAPSNGGLPCIGSATEDDQCTISTCKVNGAWSMWTSWSSCSKSCGIGLQRRDRTCTSPTPEPGGLQCPGDSRDDQICFLKSCADGGWSTWTAWTACSASCLGGISKRTRQCNNPTPSRFGHDCVGNDVDQRLCNSVPCQGTSPMVRLVGGTSAYNGRLEVLYNGEWGSVCDDDFNVNAARVVCRMLHADNWQLAQVVSSSKFGQGHGIIHLDNVRCSGTEINIFDCHHNTVDVNDCSHSEDVGVVCPLTGTTSAPVIPVRLVNGPSHLEGRLEVYHNGQWGTVCDDNFDHDAARVVCRMLNAPSGATPTAFSNAHYGPGTLPILLDSVSCAGTESSIFDCSHDSWRSNDCDHTEDVGVSCVESNISIRLTGGNTMHEGRVEVYHQGQWGTICDDQFDNMAAQVACRMLNFTGGVTIPLPSNIGTSSLPILLDDVICSGSERSLSNCKHSAWGSNNCDHGEDVAVNCNTSTTSTPVQLIRLVNGSSHLEGRLEVYHNGQWGTVCDDNFDNDAARVVCRMLNAPSGATPTAFSNAHYGPGTLPILLDSVSCAGTESSIFDCSHDSWRSNDCDHTEDVGVSCVRSNMSIRLTGGNTMHEGRVEVYHLGQWGTICDDHFDNMAAHVACRMLNFTGGVAIPLPSNIGTSSLPILLDDVICSGSERSLSNCKHSAWGSNNCDHGEDVAVNCNTSTTSAPVQPIRLMNGSSHLEGRLEVYHNGQWGTVCDDGFDNDDARVVCRMLNAPSGASATAFSNAYYGPGTLPILLDSVSCAGTESSIFDCSHDLWSSNDCDHTEDVGVSCVQSNIAIRLTGGNTMHEGRVEVYHHGQWGTICDDHFDNMAAQVACRMLNFTGGVAISLPSNFGTSSLPILLDDVACSGSERSLSYCNHKPWGSSNCDHGEDVGVNCTANLLVRLVGGSSSYTGRVEVSLDGSTWGTVCDDGFRDQDAQVVCRMLGLPTSGASAFSGAGSGTGEIFLDDVVCNGNETSLLECSHLPWKSNDCDHGEDVSVRCP